MNHDGLQRLVAEVFADQEETDAFDLISDERFREVHLGKDKFTENEQAKLLLSPRIRADYERVKCLIKAGST